MSPVERELAAKLAGLTVDPPENLLDRVVARWTRVPGPLGELYAAITERGIAYLRLCPDSETFVSDFRARFHRPLLPAERPPADLRRALEPGAHDTEDIPVDLRGLTDFERDVLAVTRQIPIGHTRSYAWVARQIGRPTAVRAVGSALGRNPVPIVIPCHRVTRSDGGHGGYIFGPAVKQRLLSAERACV